MWRVAALWLAAGAALGVAQDANMAAAGLLSLLGTMRPAKTVVRTIRASAPELFVNLEQQMRGWGYPLETHTVRTEDGYLLTLHRVPRGRAGANSSSSGDDASRPRPRPPVLLQHGFISCSDFWLFTGPGRSPALMLADRGYDVWLNNFRGNHYSKKHEKMGRRDKKFWQFSWHEMGFYDVPAAIDYVLNVTKQENLFFVGHSMGNTVFYVSMSMRPEYNAKIRLHVSLAPAVYLNETTSAAVQTAVANADYIKGVIDVMPTYEVLSKTDATIAINYLVCCDKAYFNKLCAVLYSWVVGATDLNNTTNLCSFFARSTSGTSAIVAWHYAQIARSGEFRQLDRGPAENLRAYGAARPPAYPLEKVTVPVAMYASATDFLVSSKSTERLSRMLPNVVQYKVIQEKFFNHNDYVIHPRVKEILMEQVVEKMDEF